MCSGTLGFVYRIIRQRRVGKKQLDQSDFNYQGSGAKKICPLLIISRPLVIVMLIFSRKLKLFLNICSSIFSTEF